MDRIDTDTKAFDLFGAGKHGFTAGDPQAGVPATQISATWMNDVQESLLYAIETTDQTPAAEDVTQVLKAMGLAGRDRLPEYVGEYGADATMRSYNYATQQNNWLWREFVSGDLNFTSGNVGAVGWDVPLNVHFSGSVTICVVRTDDSSAQAGYTLHFHGHNLSGTAIIDHEDITYGSDGGLAIDSVFMDYASDSIYVKVDTNAIPGSKKYNLAAHFAVQCVTRYEP